VADGSADDTAGCFKRPLLMRRWQSREDKGGSKAKDERRTNDELLNELRQMRERVAEVEAPEAEAVLRRLATVVLDSNDAITVQTPDGTITAWNRGAELMYGYTEAEALGRNIREIVPDDMRGEALVFVEALERGEGMQSLETQRVTKDGRVLDVWLTVTALVDHAGRITEVATTERDVTERKRAEEELRRHRDELDELVKERTAELARSNAELEQFAYVASHDLQEPLRMVTSYVELLARRYEGKLDADADEFIRYAVDGADRMQKLIEGLLAYSRVGTRCEEFAPTDMEAVLERVLQNLQVGVQESGAVVTRDALPAVVGDEAQLGQVFENLIGNAIKFRGEEPPRIHVSAEQEDGRWAFSVRDNGIGIDAEHQERVFGIFQRLHGREEYGGVGIGLALCRRIVERHGGHIWVESEPGEGSTFFFTIAAWVKSSEESQAGRGSVFCFPVSSTGMERGS